LAHGAHTNPATKLLGQSHKTAIICLLFVPAVVMSPHSATAQTRFSETLSLSEETLSWSEFDMLQLIIKYYDVLSGQAIFAPIHFRLWKPDYMMSTRA
jgi:hypothetical protein